MFDDEKTVTLEGVVKEFQYTNPHSWLLVDVTGADGKVVTWGFEAEGPTTLMMMQVRRSDFAPGTKLTISGHPMKDGRPAAAWVKAVRADGKEFFRAAARQRRRGQARASHLRDSGSDIRPFGRRSLSSRYRVVATPWPDANG